MSHIARHASGIVAGLGGALLCGLVNGLAVAWLKLSPFVVMLGMLSIACSQALMLSNHKMIYRFGPDQKLFFRMCQLSPLPVGHGTAWVRRS
jgi:ribose/xylose/arabinose/galactoside ABC-type transport system permease subunit